MNIQKPTDVPVAVVSMGNQAFTNLILMNIYFIVFQPIIYIMLNSPTA
jgi:hypothetical protein